MMSKTLLYFSFTSAFFTASGFFMDIALGPQIQALLDLPTPYYSSLLEGESAYEGLREEIAKAFPQ